MFIKAKYRIIQYLLKSILLCVSGIGFQVMSETLTLEINYVKLIEYRAPALSNIFLPAVDSGYQGAKLAINDSNTTGIFLEQHFNLEYFTTKKPDQVLQYVENEYGKGRRIFIIDAPLTVLEKTMGWAKNKPVLLFNTSESADELRNNCVASIFHTIPSYAMKSDALAQWLLNRRLSKVLLISGKKDQDLQLVKSFKRSAKRYGLKIIDEKQWDFNTDIRRSAQQEIPLFTQTVRDYDVVYVADNSKDFAEFIPFNTFLPRPVVGSAGLEALAWHEAIEQWGAAQLQRRFTQLSDRRMNEKDFAGYLAVRTVAQAVHKIHSNDSTKLIDYINSDSFDLAAYKGRKLSYRKWNHQIRMPLALVQPNALVSQSPQPGMLHPSTELDTLGFDLKELQCN